MGRRHTRLPAHPHRARRSGADAGRRKRHPGAVPGGARRTRSGQAAADPIHRLPSRPAARRLGQQPGHARTGAQAHRRALPGDNQAGHRRHDYVRTARAKGLPERRVIYKHVLKNGLIPVVTVLGLQFGVLLAGAIITERVFSWPGVGSLLVDSISERDYKLTQGCILVIAATYVLVNTATDLAYRFLDPRIKID